jgi:HK97 family phage major capsid protein
MTSKMNEVLLDSETLNHQLRDPYSAKPYVLFYTTRRVGGGVQDFDAIKLLKFAA